MLIRRILVKVIKEICALKDPIGYARIIGVNVGKKCRFINFPDFDSEPYLITLGDHVEISKNVRFITHDGAIWTFRDKPDFNGVVRYGEIVIGNNVFIGTRSTIMPNVHIGDDSIVGACSLVTKDIPDGEVWGGVPARFICKTEEYAKKCMKETPDYYKEGLENRKLRKKTICEIARKRRESIQK